MKNLLLFSLLLFSSSMAGAYSKIVSIGGDATEILVSLGFEERIVGIDKSSIHPANLKAEQLGHWGKISLESILVLKPDLLVYSKNYTPSKKLLQKLESRKLKLVSLTSDNSLDGVRAKILKIGKLLGAEKKANDLIRGLDRDYQKAMTVPLRKELKVLFVYAKGKSLLLVGGKDTSADSFIEASGATNVASSLSGFKKLSAEYVMKSNPDVILMMDYGSKSLKAHGGILKIPGMKHTTAGKNENLISINALKMLGFTPRLGQAVLEFRQQASQLNF